MDNSIGLREIVADYKDHFEGQREVVDWDRRVGDAVKTFRDVPVMYLRKVTKADYLATHPNQNQHDRDLNYMFFWEVSVD